MDETAVYVDRDEELAGSFRDLAEGDMIRVAPEKHAWVPRDKYKPGNMVMCRWARSPDGTFRPVPVGSRWVRLCPAAAAELGFRHLDRRIRYETIMRLHRAGMINMVQISPRVFLLDLESWFKHLAACAENPDMWEVGSPAREEYRFKNGMAEEERK